MKNSKNIKSAIIGVSTLLFALTLNFRHSLDNYGVSKNKLHVQVLAQSYTSGGGASGSWSSGSSSSKDYVYLEKRVVASRYANIVTWNTGVKTYYYNLPIGLGSDVKVSWGWVYDYIDCEGLALARCDQNSVGDVVARNSSVHYGGR